MKKLHNSFTRYTYRHFWFFLVLFVSFVIFFSYRWFYSHFDVTLEAIIFTLRSPLEGADSSFITNALPGVLTQSILFTLAFTLLCFGIQSVFHKSEVLSKWIDRFIKILCALSLPVVLVWCGAHIGAMSYIKRRMTPTHIYESYYVDPADLTFEIKGEPKNLIFIYLESMELAYTSKEDGGFQEENLIPGLTDLAKQNIYFSDNDDLGGYYNMGGLTSWTVASMFASSSGLPLSIPILSNRMERYSHFAPGVTTLGDILNSLGYNQEFICGSDKEFGGRDILLEQHGNYEIFDYYTAIEQGYIPEDYYVWWGYEDKYLYQIAKDEVLRLSAQEEPFNLTLLTVDTHHEGGYVCDLCEDEYEEPLANVLRCADHQVIDFIDWCKDQDFYEDTVIVVVGDHPRMDTILMDGVSYQDRKVYNCFINTGFDKNRIQTKNRVATALDLFPTTLSALHIKFDGNRLGLGTDLFSEEETLEETIGIGGFAEELSKYSSFYNSLLSD